MKVVGTPDHLLPHLLRSHRCRLQPLRYQCAHWYHLPLHRGGFGAEHSPSPVPPQRMPSSSGEGAQFANWAGGERTHYRYSLLDLSAPVLPLGQLPWKREPCPAGDGGRGSSTESAVSAPFVTSVHTGATFPDAGKASAYKEIDLPWHSHNHGGRTPSPLHF